MTKINEEMRKAILEYFYNSEENGSVTISNVFGVPLNTVNRILNKEMKRKINLIKNK